MAWSFGNDPLNNDKDAVRILVGDTDESDPIIDDEVIEFFISEEPNKYYAAQRTAMALASKMARLERSDEHVRYKELAQDLRYRAGMEEPGVVFTGGITRTGIPAPSDLPDLFFTREMHDNT